MTSGKVKRPTCEGVDREVPQADTFGPDSGFLSGPLNSNVIFAGGL